MVLYWESLDEADLYVEIVSLFSTPFLLFFSSVDLCRLFLLFSQFIKFSTTSTKNGEEAITPPIYFFFFYKKYINIADSLNNCLFVVRIHYYDWLRYIRRLFHLVDIRFNLVFVGGVVFDVIEVQRHPIDFQRLRNHHHNTRENKQKQTNKKKYPKWILFCLFYINFF
jgi:hypothetical protein